MRVTILGASGAIGRLVAAGLLAGGDQVHALVRREAQAVELAAEGADATVGDLGTMSATALATVLSGSDAVVFAAGANGGARATTDAIDGRAVATTIDAARLAGVRRLLLVSVLPESWRERALSDDEEHYFAVKKRADVAVAESDLDWVVLRPSLLTDEPATGRVALGPAQPHGSIARADVADVVVALLREPRVRRRILELDGEAPGLPIADAIARSVEA